MLLVSHIDQLATFFGLPHRLFFEQAERASPKQVQTALFNPAPTLVAEC